MDGWLRPESWRPGAVQALAGEGGGLAVARVGRSERQGDTSILELHYLIGDGASVEHRVERHELTLFTDDNYREAFAAAGLVVEVVESPMADRDRYVGTWPRRDRA